MRRNEMKLFDGAILQEEPATAIIEKPEARERVYEEQRDSKKE